LDQRQLPAGLAKKRRPFRADGVSVQSVDLQIIPRPSDPYGLDIDQSEVELSAPIGAGRGEQLLAGAMQKLVEAQGGDTRFQYRLSLSPEETRALREGDLAAFWEKALSGIVPVNAEDLVARAQNKDASQEGRVDKAIGTLRELLGRGDDD